MDIQLKSRRVPEPADAPITADSRMSWFLPFDVKVFGDSPKTLQKSWKATLDM